MELTLQKLDEIREIARMIDADVIELESVRDNILIKVPKTINGILGHFVVVLDK